MSSQSIPTLRLFIAIEIPQRDSLAALQKRLQPLDKTRAIRWTAPDSIHLTLKFLGETPASRQSEIETALIEAAKDHAPFDLTIGGVGCFPDLRKPRVVWAGLGGGVTALISLRDAVERTVSPLGYPTEARPFSPHLTLGRARQDAARSALAAFGEQIGKQKIDTLYSWRVDGISLMRSELKPSGAVYTQLVKIVFS